MLWPKASAKRIAYSSQNTSSKSWRCSSGLDPRVALIPLARHEAPTVADTAPSSDAQTPSAALGAKPRTYIGLGRNIVG
jgi:hypothetical protein